MATVTTITNQGAHFDIYQFFTPGATRGNGTYRAPNGDTLVFSGSGQNYTSAEYFERDGGQLVLTARITGFSALVDDINGAQYPEWVYAYIGDITFRGRNGNDFGRTGWGDDTLLGGAGSDTLYDLGYDDDDLLSGGEGNDVLGSAHGTDIINGGAGIDTLDLRVVRHPGASVDLRIADYQMVTMEPPEYLEGLLARLISIENVTGTSDGDWIAGNGVANRLVGGAGFDIIEGGGGNDLLEGGLDNDRLSGGSGDDTLSGGAHDDRLLGGADSDYLVGGEGGDTLDGGLGDDILNGGSGFDYADYSAFASNTVRLADLGVQNVGQAGKDRLISVEGLVGGKGADVFVGDALGNVLDGGSGHDTLNGGDGNDTLFGRTGRDSLFGSTGLDSLGGGDGDDVIDGGAGTDVLAGDAGADRFVFRSAAEANDDVVFDFFGSQGDRLDLRLIDANSSAGGDQGFAFIGAAGFTGVAGQLRYQTTSSTPGTPVFVQGDTNGDAQADFQITVLPGVPYPVVSDFLL